MTTEWAAVDHGTILSCEATLVSKRVRHHGRSRRAVVRVEDDAGTLAPFVIPEHVTCTALGVGIGDRLRIERALGYRPPAADNSPTVVCPDCRADVVRQIIREQAGTRAVDRLRSQLGAGELGLLAQPGTQVLAPEPTRTHETNGTRLRCTQLPVERCSGCGRPLRLDH